MWSVGGPSLYVDILYKVQKLNMVKNCAVLIHFQVNSRHFILLQTSTLRLLALRE